MENASFGNRLARRSDSVEQVSGVPGADFFARETILDSGIVATFGRSARALCGHLPVGKAQEDLGRKKFAWEISILMFVFVARL